MIVKVLIVLVFLAILASLAYGMFSLIRDNGQSRRTVKALTWRISLCLGLVILLIVGYAAGIVKPHGLIPAAPQSVPATSEN